MVVKVSVVMGMTFTGVMEVKVTVVRVREVTVVVMGLTLTLVMEVIVTEVMEVTVVMVIPVTDCSGAATLWTLSSKVSSLLTPVTERAGHLTISQSMTGCLCLFSTMKTHLLITCIIQLS